MNKALYRAMIKQNAGKILSYSAGSGLYGLLLTGVYPSIAKSSAVAEIAASFPTTVKSVFGVSGEANLNSFEAYISGQFFSRIWALVMSIYGIGTAQSLFAELLDQGFLAYPLAAPLSRREIVVTQTGALLTGLAVLTGVSVSGVILGCHWQEIKIHTWRYYRLGVLGFAFFSAISSYSLVFSVMAESSQQAMFYSAGLTLFFYALDVTAGLNEKFKWLKHFTLFGLFRPQEVLDGESPARDILMLLGIAVGMFFLAEEGFRQRDLPV